MIRRVLSFVEVFMKRSIPGLPGASIRRSLLRGVRVSKSARQVKLEEERSFAQKVIDALLGRVQAAELKGHDKIDVMLVAGYPKKGAARVDHETAAQIVADHIRAQGAEVSFEDRYNRETGFDARVLSMQWRRAA